MIFITVGSQKFQFNRLLKKIDEMLIDGQIKDEVFAQIGYSDYIPINYRYTDFLKQEEFNKKVVESSFIITHAGTGAIINSLKREKKVIAVARMKKYKEHVDDHQIQIANEFKELGFIEAVYEIDELFNAIKNVTKKTYNTYISNTNVILESIKNFIEQ